MCRHVELLFVAVVVPTLNDTPTDKNQCSDPVSFRSNRLLARTSPPLNLENPEYVNIHSAKQNV
jgi:hypothetical protein